MTAAEPACGSVTCTSGGGDDLSDLPAGEQAGVVPRFRRGLDGLHERAGSRNVIELHGNSTYASCLDCGMRHEIGPIREAFLRDETPPVCTACGGVVKTATISFTAAILRAQAVAASCSSAR